MMLSVAVLFGLLASVVGVSRLALSGYALALVIEGDELSKITIIVLAIAGSIFLRAVFQYFKETIGHRVALSIQISMRREVYSKAIELGPGTLDQKRSGDILLSLVEGVDQLESYFGEYIAQFFVALVAPVGLFIFMVWLDVTTAIIYLVAAITTLLLPSVFHFWNSTSGGYRRESYAEWSAEFLDSVQGLATLKAFGQSGERGKLLAVKARNVYRSTMKILAANQATTGVTWLGITSGAAIALGWGALRVDDGSLELTTLLVVMMLGVEVFRPLRELTSLYHKGMLGMSSAIAVFDLLDSKPIVENVTEGHEEQISIRPTLEFRNVTFKYPTRDTNAVLDVCFKVGSGETVAVVGSSGAGKSTLVWLALRFFDPTEGQVFIGDYDLKSIPLQFARKQIAVVTQDTYLFHGTVAYNLKLGNPNASQDDLEKAANAANALEFIRDLPQGFDTVIGERGIRLSGGQRQRIAIARAILTEAPILILDEALSSVDVENEAIIQQALERLMEGRTTLVIAHRLSSVINADRIMVIEDGNLVEQGTHQDLISIQGSYSTLMKSQLEYEHRTKESIELDQNAHFDTETPKKELKEQYQQSLDAEIDLSWRIIFGRLLELTGPLTWMLVATFVLGVLRVVVLVGIGIISALIVRDLVINNDPRPLLVILGVLATMTPVLHWLESWVSHDMAFRLLAEMRVAVFNKLDQLAPAYMFRRRSGDITSLVTSDIETLEFFFAHTVAPAFVAIVVPASILVTVAVVQLPLALVLLVFLIFVAYTPFQARKALDKLGYDSREQLGEVNAHMVDGIQGMREIVAFGQERRRIDEVETNQRAFGAYRLKFLKYLSGQRILIEMANGLGGLSVLAVGAYFVSEGSLSSEMLPLLSIIALSSFIPVSEVAQVVKQLADTLGSSRRLFEVHDHPVQITSGPGVAKENYSGSVIAFEEVDFRYEQGLERVLKDVAFVIHQGQKIALVGRSGAGKTTVAHLLLRFWDPEKGSIKLDSHNLTEYKLDELRDSVSLVAQDTYLFNSTVRANLTVANPTATEDELLDAAKKAAAHEFIMTLPDQYDTLVGERGFQLSGGQRQRIAIARAFLKDAPVLVLDEATSHLDAVNESLVHNALGVLMEHRSSLIIAHRLSTIRDADIIVVIDDGRVVESGTSDDLMASGGAYSQMVGVQITNLSEENY